MAKILVVENERVAAWNIQESLEELGHTIVAHVVSASEAIESAAATHPDLVLMDIQLQGSLDSITAAEQIHHRHNIPVVYLTAHADPQTLQRATISEAAGYLVKPLNPSELHTAIELALLRSQFEQRLAAIEQRLAMANGTIATDLSGKVVFMNPVAEDLTGWQQAEALGRDADSILDLVNADTGEAIASPIQQAIQEGRQVSLSERCVLRAKDGFERSVGERAAPIRDENGTVTGGMVVFQDITMPQQLELQLEKQVQERTLQLQQALDFEALLKRITEKVRDSLDESQILQTAIRELAEELGTSSCDTGIYHLEQQTSTITHEYIRADIPVAQGGVIDITWHHGVYARLLAGQPIQFCVIDSGRFTRPIPEPYSILACPLIIDQQAMGDMWLYRAGEEGFTAAEIRLVQQVANQCAIAIRQARLYTAAQTQVSELERLNHLKDDFLNTISHELRTPISSIKMASQLLEIRLKGLGLLETDTEQTGRYLQILQSECDREITLINNMLDLSRLDAQMEPLSPTAIRLQDWIPHLLEPFTPKIQQQQQELVVEIPIDSLSVVSDLGSLGRILTELFNNAYKYTPTQETIKVSTAVMTKSAVGIPEPLKPNTEAIVAISVSNSGVEILPHEQIRIFDKFYRVPNTDPWKHGGTGLGLALVKRLVQHVNGKIEVVSQNNWTTFTVYLPS